MASAVAQAAYNALPPDQKAQVDATTAGNPNGIQDWYDASAKAGDPVNIAAGIRGAAKGKSEDFDRFSNAAIAGWNQFYDEAASKAAGRPQYRSSRGAPGFYDKPTECPDGQSPAGPDESSPCKGTAQLLAAQGAGQPKAAGATGTGQGAAYYGQDDPLQRHLTGLLSTQGGAFSGADSGGALRNGGVFWQDNQGQPPATAPAASAAPAASLTTGPLHRLRFAGASSALGNAGGFTDPYETWKAGGRVGPQPGTATAAVAPQAAPQVASTPVSPAANPWGTTTGAPNQDGLEGLIDPRARRRDARSTSSWF